MAKASPTGPGTGFAIGIDLGTTYSCAAIYRDGVVTIIKNELGKATTPSHIAFPDLTQSVASLRTPPPVTVGDAAKYQADVNPENSIYDVKRLIGRRFDDPVLQKDIKHWPFKVVEDNNSPRVHVNGKTYHPEQISAKVLAYLKQQTEMFLGGPVTDAVITVPAYFNDGQRQATKDAGSIAGLNVLRIINEPTAAAIAYNHQLREQLGGSEPIKRKNVLIFDLGGGTFDLALLTMEGNTINVKAVDGDTHLGGQDFDNAMMDHCIQEFKTKHNVDLSQCQEDTAKGRFELNRRLRRIKNECERKKENLSGANFVQISVEVIYGGLDLNMRFKKTTFESINQQLFDRCIEIVDRTLKGAKMSTEEIDDVVLVGGSSRIPKIQTMLKDYFKGKAPCQNIKQDEAVAYGAAVQAGQMTASPKDGDKTLIKLPNKFSSEVIFTDVIPHSIGIEIHVEEGNVNNFSVIIDKNTTVPCKKMKEFSTVYDNQESCTIAIFEGESPSVADNHQLGEFELENLPPNRPKGEPIHVHMEMNDEGILKVTAECPANKVRKDISVKALKGRLKPDEVLRLKMEELFLTSTTSVWGTFTD